MPFEFVCPHCHCRTKVLDRYAGQTGPCVECGKTITMPHFNASGILVPSVSPLKKSKEQSGDGKRNWMPAIVGSGVVVTIMMVLGVVFALSWPSIRTGMRRVAQGNDIKNMKTIASALNAYSDRYGTYPTPVVVDSNGAPLYSWRVLILPFMGYEDLYKRFELSQPWNSATNQNLLREMPVEFASPNSPDAIGTNETNYVLITGPGTLFTAAGPMSRSKVEKNTLLVVETTNSTAWSEAGDIDVNRGLRVGNKSMVEIGGLHQESFTAVTADEEGMRIPLNVPQAVLDALVTPNGGENVQASAFIE